MIILVLISFYLFLFTEVNSNTIDNNYSKLEIVPTSNLIKYNDSYIFGIKIALEDGWKTYWKNPGEAGAPITLKWNEESNISQMEVLFPFPQSFYDHEVETIGYEKEIIFPVKIKPMENVDSINTELIIDYLICKEICIPISKKKEINFSFDESLLYTSKNDVIKYLSKVPVRDSGIFKIQEIYAKSEKKIKLSFIPVDSQKKKYEVYPFSDETYLSISSINSGKRINIELDIEKKVSEIKYPFFLSINDGENIEEISIFPNQIKIKSNIFYYFLLAFLGGVILNFMPCVLPVLSLKIFSLIKISEKNPIDIRKKSLSIVTGIVFSFVVLSFFLISFKMFGLELGWGFQFQNYKFLFCITTIILIFCLNLLGFFEILLPNNIANSVNNFIGKQSSKNYFFSGVFSTLMATPCSAPFLGTAIGFSIASSYQNIFFIFIFISIGFALPYLIFSIRPGLAKRFPKPGKWMIDLKFLLGLILLLTFGWFLTLLEVDKSIIILSIFLILFISILKNKNRFSLISSAMVSVLIIYIYFLPSIKNYNEIQWEEFNENVLKEYINEEQLILVDFTADWCVTCQFNKLTTLNSKKIEKFFFENNVKLIRGDWSEKDEKILNFISRFGRYGIPVNIVYGPKEPKGILLPEILTKDIVINELNLIK